ncbi:MAG: hypothetical protein AB7O80_11980 [Acetobacteraceae bacterium]
MSTTAWNYLRRTITLATWNVTEGPCRTILVPFFINRASCVVMKKWLTAADTVKVGPV